MWVVFFFLIIKYNSDTSYVCVCGTSLCSKTIASKESLVKESPILQRLV